MLIPHLNQACCSRHFFIAFVFVVKQLAWRFSPSRCHHVAQPCSETFPLVKYANGKVAGEDAKPK